jgi:pimeloyl-ACP methyl ester carboxylesterase
MHPKVSALVYVAARAPDVNEDHAALARTFPTPPASAGVVYDGEEGRMGEEAFLRDFVPELPRARARALFAAQWPFQRGLLSDRTTQAAWRSKPSFFAVSARDRVVDPGLQRFLAERMKAKILELDTGHVSLLTKPRDISALILQAAGHA